MLGILSLVYQKFDWQTFAIGVAVLIISTHLIPYVLDPYNNRRYPGPFPAKFSDAWLGWVSKSGHRSEVVHAMHEKYGPSYFDYFCLTIPLTDTLWFRYIRSHCTKSRLHC